MKNSVIVSALLALAFLFPNTNVQAQGNSKAIEDVYAFDYIYKLNMATKKDDILFDYYLTNDANYFGMDISSAISNDKNEMKVFTVVDSENAVTAIFMEMMGKKILKKSKFKIDDFDSKEDDSFTFTKIDSKTILGYQCDGFVGENKDSKITFYITNEAPVSFNKMWKNDKSKTPKGFNPAWVEKYTDNGLLMEMDFVDKKKSKNNMTMTCVGLEKTDFSVDTSEYGSMLGALTN